MTKHILVIDDAATVRMYHRKMLAEAGWAVEEAVNGLDALEKVLARDPARPFDLFVIDVNMPKMDGCSFVRELRWQTQVRTAPVLMVSTEAQIRDASAARAAGANAYLIKPARPADLVMTAALLMGDCTVARRAAVQQLGQGAPA